MMTSNNFATLLEAFFTDRLMGQLQASANTIASYRDTFCLLFKFAKARLKKEPANLQFEDLDAPFIGAFLEHLEKERGNRARSRNARLAALHSFFKYAALYDPAHSALIQRVLAIPSKRYERKSIDFLDKTEVEALLSAPSQNTWGDHRDRTLLLLMVQTGLRVSEVVTLLSQDVVLSNGAHVRCTGKGRKQRCTPLRKETVTALQLWLRERQGKPTDPLFPNAQGGFLSRDGVEYLLAKHAKTARQTCPSLERKRISPHVLRHTAAMDLLLNGIDRSVIALWLGHESLETTQVYLHANLQLKQQALDKTLPPNVKPGRYHPDDQLLSFLKNL